MDRSIPMFNRIVIEKKLKDQMNMHLRKLHQIKNNQIPKKQSFYIPKNSINKKKIMIQQEKRTQIEKQNVILFNKMNKILNRSLEKLKHYHYSADVRPRDTTYNKAGFYNNRIYQQNKDIVERISNQKSTISSKKFLQDRLRQQKLLKSLGRYPYKLTPLHQTEYSPKQTSNQKSLEKNKQINNDNQKHKSFSNSRVKKDRKKVIQLYRKRVESNDTILLIQINRYQSEYEIKVTHTESMKQYKLALSESEGNDIFTSCNYDYDYLTTCLRIVNNSLYLQMQNHNTKINGKSQNVIRQNKDKQKKLSNNKKVISFNQNDDFHLKKQILDKDQDDELPNRLKVLQYKKRQSYNNNRLLNISYQQAINQEIPQF